jgi:hypothetical protein
MWSMRPFTLGMRIFWMSLKGCALCANAVVAAQTRSAATAPNKKNFFIAWPPGGRQGSCTNLNAPLMKYSLGLQSTGEPHEWNGKYFFAYCNQTLKDLRRREDKIREILRSGLRAVVCLLFMKGENVCVQRIYRQEF